MTKRILDVGNCGADHSALRSLIGDHFDAEVVWAHSWADVEEQMNESAFDLVVVNRLLDRDGSQGSAVLDRLKAHAEWSEVPVMLVTNFEQHQLAAQESGAVPGYGKRALHSPDTIEKFARFLT